MKIRKGRVVLWTAIVFIFGASLVTTATLEAKDFNYSHQKVSDLQAKNAQEEKELSALSSQVSNLSKIQTSGQTSNASKITSINKQIQKLQEELSKN